MVSMMPRSEAPATIRALRDDEQGVLAEATVGNVNWLGPRFTFERVGFIPAGPEFDEGTLVLRF